jgi:DMSO/TMAO reductase YedYZ molybdopterin-dependent catalytic subunit
MEKMRTLTETPLNAETPIESLRSWITANSVFFHRNQSELKSAVSLGEWRLKIEGELENPGYGNNGVEEHSVTVHILSDRFKFQV